MGVAQNGQNGVVLVIEDERSLRELMGELFEDNGYQVYTAVDSREGLELLKTGLRPTLILLDYLTPRMDGRGFLTARAQDPVFAEIPVVVVSGRSFTGEDRELVSTTAEASLAKPFGIEKLLETVARYSRPVG